MVCQIKTKENCRIPFFFPKNAKVHVKEKEEVKMGTLLVSYNEETFNEIDISSQLEISPNEIKKYLTITLPCQVAKDQVIALKKNLMGHEKTAFAPFEGKLSELTSENKLKIITQEVKKEILAPFDGKIVEIGDIYLTMEFRASILEADSGCGKEVVGELEVLGEREADVVLGSLTAIYKDKILLVGGEVNQGLIVKAEALGVKGFIGGRIPNGVKSGEMPLLAFKSENNLVPLEIWQFLLKNKGRSLCLFGQEKYLAIP